MNTENSGLARRFGAILYDALLVFALMMLATIPFVVVRGGEMVEPGTPLHQITLALVMYGFFAGFWARKGRTLGMQSWGLQLETLEGQKPSLSRASIRFVAALVSWLPLGLGFLWQLWDKEKLAWHDRLSGTRLVYYPRPGKTKTSPEPPG